MREYIEGESESREVCDGRVENGGVVEHWKEEEEGVFCCSGEKWEETAVSVYGRDQTMLPELWGTVFQTLTDIGWDTSRGGILIWLVRSVLSIYCRYRCVTRTESKWLLLFAVFCCIALTKLFLCNCILQFAMTATWILRSEDASQALNGAGLLHELNSKLRLSGSTSVAKCRLIQEEKAAECCRALVSLMEANNKWLKSLNLELHLLL